MGQIPQAIEYLDFIQDDPPDCDGITKAQTIAFSTLTFEQSGTQYATACEQSYLEFKTAYLDIMRKGPKGEIIVKKIEKLFKTNGIEEVSEIWENMALQMLERCEYVLSYEFLNQV